jgi:hypothetical protein
MSTQADLFRPKGAKLKIEMSKKEVVELRATSLD